ncbi:sialidase family protein [Acinetobacter baumannii]|uniref:sialidase family protein n=1 Tax=Acinetobacter baumannii TaxID=470 RepID=UPI000E091397|nr:sialidase family protein [Acinetobacter baumannii]RDF39041.1 exo-alpha-sialidase [Acinetobacter baumannii]RDF57708.1 exo-alpha-sialidase [Acinetobacter baumannii]TDI19724.1 exo-alpha-sialidase [Acinetobacter baumannii]
MAIITEEKMRNLDTDIQHAGEAVNLDKVIIPRYGAPFDSFPRAIRLMMESGGWKFYSTESELLATAPEVVPSVGYAADTKKLYKWNGTVWIDEGQSPLALANKYADDLFGPLAGLLSTVNAEPLEVGEDVDGMVYRLVYADGSVAYAGSKIAFKNWQIESRDLPYPFINLDSEENVTFYQSDDGVFHLPTDIRFNGNTSLIESLQSLLNSVSSERIYKKNAGQAYSQILLNRIPARSEFTSVMTLAESNGLINRMMSGVRVSTGLFLVWHQKTKPEYDGDSSGSAFWCGFADIDSDYNITVRDKKMFIYPDTDAGIIKHPHLGRTKDNRLILVYEKSIGKVEETEEKKVDYIKYVRYSSDEGVTWTDPVLLTFKNEPPTNAQKALGTTSVVIKLATGRLIVALYSISGHCGCIYSDDDGLSWSYSKTWIFDPNWGYEPSIALDSNNDLIMSIRPRTNNPMFAAFAKSTDAGVTWSLMHKDRVVSVTNQSYLMYDETIGVHLESHDINPENKRTNFRISLSYDDGYTFPLTYSPFPEDKYVGYTQLIRWADGVYLLLFEYNDTWISVNQNEQLGIQLLTISEVINNVSRN